MGHTTPALALSIYAQVMRRDDGEEERLRTLVDGVDVDVAEIPAEFRHSGHLNGVETLGTSVRSAESGRLAGNI